MYICVYMYMYICMSICIYVYLYIYLRLMYVYVYAYMYIYMYMCRRVYMYACIHICLYMCIYVYIYICNVCLMVSSEWPRQCRMSLRRVLKTLQHEQKVVSPTHDYVPPDMPTHAAPWASKSSTEQQITVLIT